MGQPHPMSEADLSPASWRDGDASSRRPRTVSSGSISIFVFKQLRVARGGHRAVRCRPAVGTLLLP
jgi:hypothetical protein